MPKSFRCYEDLVGTRAIYMQYTGQHIVKFKHALLILSFIYNVKQKPVNLAIVCEPIDKR